MFCVGGGADSDVMVDMLLRCGARGKTDFVFFNTGVEYRATLSHLTELERKYGIQIERVDAVKPIPISVRDYGVPFISKNVSKKMYNLQKHGFQWEDEPLDVLIQKYPHCVDALKWWCNYAPDGTNNTLYMIKRNPHLKEFIMQSPPSFKVSSKCCEYAKKKVSEKFERGKQYDLKCIGVRRAEGGIRAAAYKSCFSDGGGTDQFRPVFWFRDVDKDEYCDYYGVSHSKCYTEYGFERTGCCGCPFNLKLKQDLEALKIFEPQLYKFANSVFGKSYEYTRAYRKFRDEIKRK